MSDVNTEYAAKFVKQLGTVSDFTGYVAMLEGRKQLAQLAGFKGTDGTWTGKRYLLIRQQGVIDFRHFFAAMMQRLEGSLSKPIGIGPTSEGTTLLLGVVNETRQCMGEAASMKLNSCFSREDLLSNRLGAEFGEIVTIKRAEASRETVSTLLAAYLGRKAPLPPAEVNKLKMQGPGEVALEALGAVLKSIGDALLPSAY